MTGLEHDLVALGAALDVPPGDALAERVRAAISVTPSRRSVGRWVAAVVAVIVGAGAAYTSVPAVAEWLGVKGVDIRLDDPPRRADSPVSDRLGLGRRETLHAARAAAGFEVVVPRALGAPDEVWFDDTGGARRVWLAYRNATGGYRALLMQADVRLADAPLATKFVEPGSTVEAVSIGTGRAFWIGGSHSVVFYDRRGRVVVDNLRLSDNALLWERGDVTLRLESGFGRDESLRIARSAP